MKLVLDTQIWLDWLVFDDPGIRLLRDMAHLGRAEIVIDVACDAELERVLAYELGKHRISPAAQLAALDQVRRLARRVQVVAVKGLPQCRDPDDQKFIELAAATNANALVTKDRELLRMKRRLPFRVVTPQDL